jgi:hypothetical protein
MSAVLIDQHRTFSPHCWYCGKQLDAVFTTVRKRGVDCRVHPECRPEAMSVVVEDNPDTFVVPPFVDELPIG